METKTINPAREALEDKIIMKPLKLSTFLGDYLIVDCIPIKPKEPTVYNIYEITLMHADSEGKPVNSSFKLEMRIAGFSLYKDNEESLFALDNFEHRHSYSKEMERGINLYDASSSLYTITKGNLISEIKQQLVEYFKEQERKYN